MARKDSTSRTPAASGYVVDEHAVADAIIRRLRAARRPSEVLVPGEVLGPGAVGPDQGGAFPRTHLP
jgi:hypothetical protein